MPSFFCTWCISSTHIIALCFRAFVISVAGVYLQIFVLHKRNESKTRIITCALWKYSCNKFLLSSSSNLLFNIDSRQIRINKFYKNYSHPIIIIHIYQKYLQWMTAHIIARLVLRLQIITNQYMHASKINNSTSVYLFSKLNYYCRENLGHVLWWFI